MPSLESPPVSTPPDPLPLADWSDRILVAAGPDIERIDWPTVEKALAELQFSRKRVAKQVKSVLESAIANAENNHDLDIDALVVSQAFVGKNLVMKRWSPRGRGRVGKIMKPFAEITIVVKEVEEAA